MHETGKQGNLNVHVPQSGHALCAVRGLHPMSWSVLLSMLLVYRAR